MPVIVPSSARANHPPLDQSEMSSQGVQKKEGTNNTHKIGNAHIRNLKAVRLCCSLTRPLTISNFSGVSDSACAIKSVIDDLFKLIRIQYPGF